MPQRLIRDWTDSKKIDKLSCEAERFFTRLIMKVDDFGCYLSHPRLLRIHLFPWKDDVTDTDIGLWLKECSDAELILLYTAEGKDCLHIINFKQRLRTKNRQYPAPPSETAPADVGHKPVKGTSKDSKMKASDKQKTPPDKLFVNTEYEDLRKWQLDYAPAVLRMPEPLTEAQYEKLRQEYSEEQIRELLMAMGNSKKISNHTSAFATFSLWAKNQKWTNQTINNATIEEQYAPSANWLQEKFDRALLRGQGTGPGA